MTHLLFIIPASALSALCGHLNSGSNDNQIRSFSLISQGDHHTALLEVHPAYYRELLLDGQACLNPTYGVLVATKTFLVPDRDATMGAT